MYNEKAHTWVSDCPDERMRIKYCHEAENGNPEAMFMLASDMLSEASEGKQSAEAIYLMEQAAKEEYPPAMYAMGQLFQRGWAVQKNGETALEWYRKAAACSYEPAVLFLRRRRRKKWTAACLGAAAGLFVVLAAVTVWKGAEWLSGIFPFLQNEDKQDPAQERGIIKVGEDTELIEAISFEEFSEKLQEIVDQYDSDLVISGQLSTNRLILKFEGKELDLTDYFADYVIARENNMAVLQFSTEEEAQRCFEQLQKLDIIQFVEMDEYNTVGYSENSRNAGDGNRTEILDGGSLFNSWGAWYMGFDMLTEYAKARSQGDTIVVAVLDTGVELHEETKDRILEGWDIDGGNGQTDCDKKSGHGTHVAGTILDCTQGTDVKILPVRVFRWSNLEKDAYASDLALICGMEYALQEGADVINMSLGGPIDQAKAVELQMVLDADAVVIAAAGNDAQNTADYWPACEESCVVVGAIDSDLNVACFSNFGDSLDVVAPGVGIISDGTGSERYRELDGTSMAAPHVSALAALLRMIYPNANREQIEKYIIDYSLKSEDADQTYCGYGLPIGSLFVEE